MSGENIRIDIDYTALEDAIGKIDGAIAKGVGGAVAGRVAGRSVGGAVSGAAGEAAAKKVTRKAARDAAAAAKVVADEKLRKLMAVGWRKTLMDFSKMETPVSTYDTRLIFNRLPGGRWLTRGVWQTHRLQRIAGNIATTTMPGITMAEFVGIAAVVALLVVAVANLQKGLDRDREDVVGKLIQVQKGASREELEKYYSSRGDWWRFW